MPPKNKIEINAYINENINTSKHTEAWVLEVGDMGPGGPLILIVNYYWALFPNRNYKYLPKSSNMWRLVGFWPPLASFNQVPGAFSPPGENGPEVEKGPRIATDC